MILVLKIRSISASRCELVRNSAGKCERACVGFAVQAEPEDSGSSGGSSRPSGGSSSGGKDFFYL